MICYVYLCSTYSKIKIYCSKYVKILCKTSVIKNWLAKYIFSVFWFITTLFQNPEFCIHVLIFLSNIDDSQIANNLYISHRATSFQNLTCHDKRRIKSFIIFYNSVLYCTIVSSSSSLRYKDMYLAACDVWGKIIFWQKEDLESIQVNPRLEYSWRSARNSRMNV